MTIVDGGFSVSSTKTVVVTPTLNGIRLVTPGGQVVNYPAVLSVTGASQAVVAQGLDQFGAVMAAPPVFTWSEMPLSAGTAVPTITSSGNTANVAFTKMGLYALTAKAANYPNVASMAELNVVQTLQASA